MDHTAVQSQRLALPLPGQQLHNNSHDAGPSRILAPSFPEQQHSAVNTSTSASQGSPPQPRKRQKVPRSSGACQRCRQRKQRCDKGFSDNPSQPCRNCQIFGSVCVPGPASSTGTNNSNTTSNGSKSNGHSHHVNPGLESVLPPLNATDPTFLTLERESISDAGQISRHNAESLSFFSGIPNVPIASNGSLNRSPGSDIFNGTLRPEDTVRSVYAQEGTEDATESVEDGSIEVHSPQDAARGVAFLSVSANGNPVYVGPSSGFSWAQVVLGGVNPPLTDDTKKRPTTSGGGGDVLPLMLGLRLPDEALVGISDEVANIVLTRVYRHLQPRYPFLDWLWIHEIWRNRMQVVERANSQRATRVDKTNAFFMWMIFALGSRYCQKTHLPHLAAPELYYTKAMTHLEIIVGLHDYKNVQGLLLMVMYSFRSAEAPSVWFLMGIAMRLCISLGLHRGGRCAREVVTAYNEQMRRRIFWSAYVLERMLAITLGRPPSIGDHDIDIPMPDDVDCVDVNVNPTKRASKVTSMTSAIHYMKLTRIQSEIQREIYRVDQTTEAPTEYIDSLLRRIDEWESRIPTEAAQAQCWALPCCSKDWFLIRSAEARLHVLRPSTVSQTSNTRYIRLLANTAADACELQKRYHQEAASVPSLESLRSVFLAGLTLLHASNTDPTAVSYSNVQRSVRSASNMLFSYAQQFPSVGHFHDAFEELASATLDRLAQNQYPQSQRGETALPPVSINNTAIDWQNLLQDLPSAPFQDSTTSLLESFGIMPMSYPRQDEFLYNFDNDQSFSTFDTDSFLASVNVDNNLFSNFTY